MSNPTLNYAEPTTLAPLPPAWQSRSFRIAIGCWIVPLAIGVGIFIAASINRTYGSPGYGTHGWHGTPNAADLRMRVFQQWGMYDIAFGTIAAVVALISITAFTAGRRRPASNRGRAVIVPVLVVYFLLASNFVVALVLAIASI